MDVGKLRIAFGKTLTNLRKSQGVSQQELSDHTEVDRSFISAVENGKHLPAVPIFYTICDYLKTKPADFIRSVDNEIEQSHEIFK